MKNDINVDSSFSFSVLVESEISKFNFPLEGIKERIVELCELSFKAGFKAGQLRDNIPIDLKRMCNAL